ncbi:MAG: hypothetical protein A2167_02665 [Planctomycetes bacterium RBG_13_46_10]|nr:MAG: hypothetical protein A2167_02665 [Planctomycetes bacterium RBG_13_46_10]
MPSPVCRLYPTNSKWLLLIRILSDNAFITINVLKQTRYGKHNKSKPKQFLRKQIYLDIDCTIRYYF